MDFDDVVRRRRMVRAFAPEPVAREVVDGLLELARRAPSAGNTRSVEFLVLEGPDRTAPYWDITLPPQSRSAFPWPELPRAPVIIVVWVDPAAYVARYSEPDKERSGLGAGLEAWPVPYWWVDGGAAVMTILLAAVDRGLGALFFGLFGHEAAIRDRFGVPASRRAVGAVALGQPAPDRPSGSARRLRPAFDDVVHRGRWPAPGEVSGELGHEVVDGGDR